MKERYFFIEADEAFSKCACSVKYLHQLFAADRYLHAVICMQLFAGELKNQNQEYYKVNDNSLYMQSPLKNFIWYAMNQYEIQYDLHFDMM